MNGNVAVLVVQQEGAQAYPIDIWGVVIAVAMTCAAAAISAVMRLGIGKGLLLSSARALLQLTAMGFVLRFVIEQNNSVYVVALLVLMLPAAVQITLSRAAGVPKGLAIAVFMTLSVTMLLMVVLVPELIIRPKPWYAPQVVVPITGMLLGNAVSACAVALSRFFEDMRERRNEVETLLALGATPLEAAQPSMASSIRLGLLPTIASLASTGVVTIPGMMTGQIIAGADPLLAARYQFVITISIGALTLLSSVLIIMLTYRRCFNEHDQYLSLQ